MKHRNSKLTSGAVVAALVAAICAVPGTAAPQAPQEAKAPAALELVARYPLPSEIQGGVADARWAGPDSIFLATNKEGVMEVRLKEGLPQIRRALVRQRGWPPIMIMAASKDWLLAADGGAVVAWAPVDAVNPSDEIQVSTKDGIFHDLDVHGDQVVLLGFQDVATFLRSSGGVLWRADLSKGLDTWEALFESRAVGDDYNIFGDHVLASGSVRFMRNGGFVVAPNFLPGVMLFSSTGKLKTTWSPKELWGDGEETGWQEKGLGEPASLGKYLAARRIIEEVLPLPEGAAIVVREPKGDGAKWRLGVLGPEVQWYDIPVSGVSSVARLRGDADAKGRIVLVGTPREFYESARVSENEVLVLRLPR